jgi:signal transduction histidine kinase
MDALGEEPLRALIEAGRAVISELDLETILTRVLESSRQVCKARYAAMGVLDEDRQQLERFVALGVDEETHRRIGSLPTGKGVLGVLIEDPRPLRLDSVGDHPKSVGFPAHHPRMGAFLGVPVMIRDVAWGNLYLTEKLGGGTFTEADEEAAVILADFAAIAVDHSRSVDRARLRQSIESAEHERGRWARELHDETLQGLGALRVALASALRTGGDYESVVSEAVAQLGEEIRKLRGLITDLRPASLDQIGLQAALEDLARRASEQSRVKVTTVVALAYEAGDADARLPREFEQTIYRIAQEGVMNAIKHAHATRVEVRLVERDSEVAITVIDDGVGFDPIEVTSGYGLAGIRERADLARGSVQLESAAGAGTTLTARLPIRGRR